MPFWGSNGDKQNFHSVTTGVQPDQTFSPLQKSDLEWACASGFVTETKTFYHGMEDGTHLMFQVVYSSVSILAAQTQFTCKVYRPGQEKPSWHSLSVKNFVAPPPASGSKTYDKRSCKADEFSLIHSEEGDKESYIISANVAADLQIMFTVTRETQGFKYGQGPKAGYSYFGSNTEKPEGYVVHRFWPRTSCTGQIVQNGKAATLEGHGMFVHAIQGMRPNLVASAWNFLDFQSDDLGGVSGIQMEFTTTENHGKTGTGSGGVVVNVGSLVVKDKLVAVCGETRWPGDTTVGDAQCRASHVNLDYDPETTYDVPKDLNFVWQAPALDKSGTLKATLDVDVGTSKEPKGLLHKVDFLAEIPYIVRKFVNVVAGTKPFLYQWNNPGTMEISGPESLIPGGKATVKGIIYNEATFLSKK